MCDVAFGAYGIAAQPFGAPAITRPTVDGTLRSQKSVILDQTKVQGPSAAMDESDFHRPSY